mmetsp:Transcript_89522/g.261661  ORF Transcript_89522/g.261661 Transcript_89522/m.261661 type:complete len:291 (+) Transcript_89522:653-1525(+)
MGHNCGTLKPGGKGAKRAESMWLASSHVLERFPLQLRAGLWVVQWVDQVDGRGTDAELGQCLEKLKLQEQEATTQGADIEALTGAEVPSAPPPRDGARGKPEERSSHVRLRQPRSAAAVLRALPEVGQRRRRGVGSKGTAALAQEQRSGPALPKLLAHSSPQCGGDAPSGAHPTAGSRSARGGSDQTAAAASRPGCTPASAAGAASAGTAVAGGGDPAVRLAAPGLARPRAYRLDVARPAVRVATWPGLLRRPTPARAGVARDKARHQGGPRPMRLRLPAPAPGIVAARP